MHSTEHHRNRPDEVAESLQGMGQSLHRLVELGESVLNVLERSSATLNAEFGNGSPQPTAPRSVRCSAHSENSVGVGVFDVSTEDIISFAQASAMVPTHPSTSTIWRWCSVGCRGIKLECVYIGGRRKTSRQAVERFLLACRKQQWIGMHDAFQMERAIAEMGLLADQQTDDAHQHAGQGQPSADGAAPAQTGKRTSCSRSRRGAKHRKRRS